MMITKRAYRWYAGDPVKLGAKKCSRRGIDGGFVDLYPTKFQQRLEGLDGIGAGATLIFPSGDVIGLSRDHPRAKHFAPERMAAH